MLRRLFTGEHLPDGVWSGSQCVVLQSSIQLPIQPRRWVRMGLCPAARSERRHGIFATGNLQRRVVEG